ncbi:MAG: S-layer homology domain-containing protein, partial [Clostridiaceae bacterium]|nr:S-layer homology domain-containing protein [Clostridiaceae bacterium]
MKKTISLLVISILIIEIMLTSIGHNYVLADDLSNRKATFDDIAGHWCQEFIEKFTERKWVFGYDDGLFYPDKYVTRAEFTAMVVKIFKKTTRQSDSAFIDVSKNDWFYNAVTCAADENLIKGYEDGTF